MSFLSFFFNKKILPIKNNQINESFQIPEPTKSLIFITNDDISKIQSPNSIKITISFTDDGTESNTSDGKNIYGEPSVIWTKLPIIKNNWLEEKAMYYPSYYNLSPEHRYQYLKWLQDITQPTNLSYVFLYYYGLERHLLFGNFELAFNEIIKLLNFHDKGTFRSYAEKALIVSSLFRKRFDLIEKNTLFYDGVSNEELLIKKYMNINLSPKDLIFLSNMVGMKNKRYIKLYPEKFETELEKNMINYELKNGRILDSIDVNYLKLRESIAFANYSLKNKVRTIKIPDLITDKNFCNICLSLLKETHEKIKNNKRGNKIIVK